MPDYVVNESCYPRNSHDYLHLVNAKTGFHMIITAFGPVQPKFLLHFYLNYNQVPLKTAFNIANVCGISCNLNSMRICHLLCCHIIRQGTIIFQSIMCQMEEKTLYLLSMAQR